MKESETEKSEFNIGKNDRLKVVGPSRTLNIGGYECFQPTSIQTNASFETQIHQKNKGTLSIWLTPLEDLGMFVYPNEVSDKFIYRFPLLSDVYPPRNTDEARFALYLENSFPPLVCKFADGGVWQRLDYESAPTVYSEVTDFRIGEWYLITVSWDRESKSLKLYVNGVRVGDSTFEVDFMESSSRLYVGNPLVCLRDLEFEDEVLSDEEIALKYESCCPEGGDALTSEIRAKNSPVDFPDLDLERGDEWDCVFERSFLNEGEDEGLFLQTGDLYRERFNLEITQEGLLFETPDIIHKESRGYVWLPGTYEGDLWIEYDFRLESPNGLALILFYASGMQREDFHRDHGLLNTGAMGTMLTRYRNYHWEYMRRVCGARTDHESHYVHKNPWGRNFYRGCSERYEMGEWYRIRVVKAKNRIHGSINGRTVFDVMDDPFRGAGPVYNFGRIALRQMFDTKMRYRNLSIHQRSLW